MSEERRAKSDRRDRVDRRKDDDWLYLGPERRKQTSDRRTAEGDRRHH